MITLFGASIILSIAPIVSVLLITGYVFLIIGGVTKIINKSQTCYSVLIKLGIFLTVVFLFASFMEGVFALGSILRLW